MCSFHFKQLEGKIDAWLPTEKGNRVGPPPKDPILEEIRVFMRWDPERGTTRKIGSTVAADDAALMEAIRVRKGDYERAGKSVFPIIIDATADVPWSHVVHVVDLCKTDKLTNIEFAEPMEYRSSSR
jgi:hypothetical protein